MVEFYKLYIIFENYYFFDYYCFFEYSSVGNQN